MQIFQSTVCCLSGRNSYLDLAYCTSRNAACKETHQRLSYVTQNLPIKAADWKELHTLHFTLLKDCDSRACPHSYHRDMKIIRNMPTSVWILLKLLFNVQANQMLRYKIKGPRNNTGNVKMPSWKQCWCLTWNTVSCTGQPISKKWRGFWEWW